jgi:transposase
LTVKELKPQKVMSQTPEKQVLRCLIGPQLSDNTSINQYEVSFRRWLAREYYYGRVSVQQIVSELGISVTHTRKICSQYAPEVVTLPAMTEAEKQKLEELEKQVKLLQKQLEYAEIKNIALETLIDVAENDLKIPIRKKPGAKQ